MTLQNDITEIKSFVPDEETMIDAYSSEEATGVLTDRRFIHFKLSGKEDNKTIINSTYFDEVAKTIIEHNTTPDIDKESLGYGIISLFVALVSIVVSTQTSGSAITGLLAVIGIGLGVMGIVLVVEAYNTPDGSVVFVLKAADDNTIVRIQLPEDHAEFTEKLSQTISNAHQPPKQLKRTVG